jgi:hypothetical protein
MEKLWRIWLTMMKMYMITQFCQMQRGMWIMQLHGMVVNQYISSMEDDEGPGDDEMSELIADLGKG